MRNMNQYFSNIREKLKGLFTAEKNEIERLESHLEILEKKNLKECKDWQEQMINMVQMRLIDHEITNLDLDSLLD